MMDRILREIEREQWQTGRFGDDTGVCVSDADRPSSRKAVAHAANTLALDLKLQGILVPTRSGQTAAVLAACRPTSPLLGISENVSTCRMLSLHWGVIPYCIEKKEANDWQLLGEHVSKRFQLTDSGNRVLLVSGMHDDELLNEPVLKIIRVGARKSRSGGR